MAKKTKSKAQLQAEVDVLRTGQIAHSITRVLTTLIKYGGFVMIVYYVRDSVVAIAGKETINSLSFTTNFITELSANKYFVALIGLLLGAGGVSYGVAQRNLKRRTVAHLSQRKEELERLIDPERHSSRLTKNGTTRPEDR